MAHVANPGSFRAEGYSILAVLCLLSHIRYFHVLSNQHVCFRQYYDSESLLKRIAVSRQLKRTIPRRYLFSEVDVEMQFLAAIQAVASAVESVHVEGHQDTKYPEQHLPWEAEPNQRCDEITSDGSPRATTHSSLSPGQPRLHSKATKTRSTRSSIFRGRQSPIKDVMKSHLTAAQYPLPTVPFLLASHASISIGQHTVTHHIATQLHTFAGLPGLRAHFVKHHEWESHVIFDIIDWPVFPTATLATSFLKRLFVIKWINDPLPLQGQQYLYKQSPPQAAHPPAAAPTKTGSISPGASTPNTNNCGRPS
jgi:hypothetical protein